MYITKIWLFVFMQYCRFILYLTSLSNSFLCFYILYLKANKNLDMSINASNNFNLNITWSVGSTGTCA